MKSKKLTAIVVAAFMIGTLLSGCTSSTPKTSGTDTKKKIVIGISMDSLESEMWVSNFNTMKEEAAKAGVEIKELIAEGDANKQNQQIENLIAQKVSVIICAPKDGAAIAVSVKKAKEAKIPMILDNRPVVGDVKPELMVLSDNYTMAKNNLQWFVDKSKKENKTYKAVKFIGSLGDGNAIEREKGYNEVIAANKDVITVVANIPTDWKPEQALAGIQNALKANPEINLVISPSDFLLPSIQSGMKQANKWIKIGQPGHISYVTFDGDNNGLQGIKDGYIETDASQGAVAQGKLCIENAIKLAKGEKLADEVIKDPGVLINMDNILTEGPKNWGWKGVK